MKWESKKIANKKWGVFLMQEFCKTDEPVCYGESSSKKGADHWVDRLNRSEESDVDLDE